MNFVNQGIIAGCDAFKDIYITTTGVTTMISNFASAILAKVSAIKAAISSQSEGLLTVLCGLLNFLLNGTTIGSAFDLIDNFGNDVVNFLQSLVGQPDETIHEYFCGDDPETVINYVTTEYTTFDENVSALDSLLSDLCVV